MAKEIERLKKSVNALKSQLLVARHNNIQIKDRNQQLTAHVEILQKEIDGTSFIDVPHKANEFEGISIVICAYNIPKQLVRTLKSCRPLYQSINRKELEVIIIDNGSKPRIRIEDLKQDFGFVSQVIRVDDHPSPVFGLNMGIKAAKFDLIGVMIDGAHILSPGICRHAKTIFELMPRPVISVPQYYLGDVSQNLYTPANAFQEEEGLLKKIKWPENGYSLFNRATIPGEHHQKSLFNYQETNCLISTRAVFEDCGAFDERFDEPGAGLANFEIYQRLVNHPTNEFVLLAGEGSFHQNHGGITTGADRQTRQERVAEYFRKYEAITGHEAMVISKPPFMFGTVRKAAQRVDIISTSYKTAKSKIIKQLRDLFVQQAENGIFHNAPQPNLTLKPDKFEYEPRVKNDPRGLLDKVEDPKPYNYLNIIQSIHDHLDPDLYFEIGVFEGQSLSKAKCLSVGVDPEFNIRNTIAAPAKLIRETSDQFFAKGARAKALLAGGVDLAFIDGMHLAEYALRDFMNTEKYMKPNGIIVIDDVLPEQQVMMTRERTTRAWCGDVYKVITVLKKFRPDLTIHVTSAFIGPYRKGLAIITDLDPTSNVLDTKYAELEAGILGNDFTSDTPEELETAFSVITPFEFADILKRHGAARSNQHETA